MIGRGSDARAGAFVLAAVAPLAIAGIACGGGSNDARDPASLDGGFAGEAAVGSVTFDVGARLTTAPSSATAVGVHADPDGAVVFYLAGDYGDASLASSTVTASGGVASVVLRAPSKAATFTLHARTASGAQASVSVSVSASGFLTLDVHPSYAGVRSVGAVTASIFADATCASLSGQKITDGALAATGSVDGSITVPDVPAGIAVAVGARIGHYAFGCADLGTERDVAIQIIDQPIAFDVSTLDVDFTPTPSADESAAWTNVLSRARELADAAFLTSSTPANPGASSEATALLDAMQSVSGAGAAFASARQNGGWDAQTSTWLGANGKTMASRIDAWMSAAEPRGLGDLLLHLAGNAGSAGTGSGLSTPAIASVTSFVALGPPASGLSILSPFAWSADAHDNVSLGGSVFLDASQLIVSLATPDSGSADVPTTLATDIDCGGLGAALANGGDAYAACDGTCLGTICRQAVAAMWTRAGLASQTQGDVTEITFNASGSVMLDDEAVPIQFSGNWTSQVSASTGNSKLHGTIASASSR